MKRNVAPSTHIPEVNSDFINALLITIIWVFMIILVNPIGDFPLNDDWAYGWTVKTLLETGRFQLSDWTATNLLPQALWGTLFCLPFGFSFTALRFSTLTLGLAGVFATYGLLREAKANPQIALLGSLLVTLNPLYFGLSNSFNSDVPSFAFFILSVYFLVRGNNLKSRFNLAIGLLFSLVAILNRQSSLIILPAFGIACLLQKRLSLKNSITSFFPTLVGLLVYSAYSHWLDTTERTPLLYGFQIEKLMETLSSGAKTIASTYIENTFLFAIYLGLFLFPLLVLQFSLQFKRFSAQQKLISLCLTLFLLGIGITFILNRSFMPMIGNALNELGLGPITLGGYNSFLNQNRYLRLLVRGSWAFLTLVGLIGASILLQYFLWTIQLLITRKNQLEQDWLLVFLFASTFLYLLPIGGINKSYWFDRYLILPLPLIMTSTVALARQFSEGRSFKPRIVAISLISLLLLGTFTITATHDYLSWNRVRWYALDHLMQNSKALPNQIGGGFEFNGRYFGSQIETCNPEFQKNLVQTSASWEDFSCFWDDANRNYMLSFIPKEGYRPQAVYSFRRWLPWREERLYVLKKN
jgi:hypothetical protein